MEMEMEAPQAAEQSVAQSQSNL